jgi:hypothetical protein
MEWVLDIAGFGLHTKPFGNKAEQAAGATADAGADRRAKESTGSANKNADLPYAHNDDSIHLFILNGICSIYVYELIDNDLV